jgi:hypothetical protein
MEWLPRLLARSDDADGFAFSDEEVVCFVAVLLLEFGFRTEELAPKLQAILAWFALEAGVTPEMGPDETRAAIGEHLEKHPLNPQLVNEFHRGLREMLSVPEDEAIAQSFARFMDQGPRRFDALLNRAPPSGAVRGGPLARFQMGEKLGK